MDFQWFLPSMYGDIKLDKVSNETTRLTLVGLSPTEREAVSALFTRSSRPTALQASWGPASRFEAVDLSSSKEQTVELDAPITKVQDFLQKKLKPHRKQVSAVRFSNGRVEQITEATLKIIDAPDEKTCGAPFPRSKDPARPVLCDLPKGHRGDHRYDSDANSWPVTDVAKPKAVAAVTVAQPVLGCPAPNFDNVEVRATRVLKAFLTSEQIEDFERRQQFVAVGADTGHRYLLTSRNSKHALESASYRSLYDIDERLALCVHDWEVPAAEELLALYVHVSLPGLERYVRSMPDRDGLLA